MRAPHVRFQSFEDEKNCAGRINAVEDIAGEFGISPQAVSQRLHRGYGTLVMTTIGTQKGDTEE